MTDRTLPYNEFKEILQRANISNGLPSKLKPSLIFARYGLKEKVDHSPTQSDTYPFQSDGLTISLDNRDKLITLDPKDKAVLTTLDDFHNNHTLVTPSLITRVLHAHETEIPLKLSEAIEYVIALNKTDVVVIKTYVTQTAVRERLEQRVNGFSNPILEYNAKARAVDLSVMMSGATSFRYRKEHSFGVTLSTEHSALLRHLTNQLYYYVYQCKLVNPDDYILDIGKAELFVEHMLKVHLHQCAFLYSPYSLTINTEVKF